MLRAPRCTAGAAQHAGQRVVCSWQAACVIGAGAVEAFLPGSVGRRHAAGPAASSAGSDGVARRLHHGKRPADGHGAALCQRVQPGRHEHPLGRLVQPGAACVFNPTLDLFPTTSGLHLHTCMHQLSSQGHVRCSLSQPGSQGFPPRLWCRTPLLPCKPSSRQKGAMLRLLPERTGLTNNLMSC